MEGTFSKNKMSVAYEWEIVFVYVRFYSFFYARMYLPTYGVVFNEPDDSIVHQHTQISLTWRGDKNTAGTVAFFFFNCGGSEKNGERNNDNKKHAYGRIIGFNMFSRFPRPSFWPKDTCGTDDENTNRKNGQQRRTLLIRYGLGLPRVVRNV